MSRPWQHFYMRAPWEKNWKSGFLGNFSPLFPRMQGWSAAIPYLEAIPLVLTNKLSVNSSGLQNQYCQFSKFLTNGHKWCGKNKDFLAVKKNCKHEIQWEIPCFICSANSNMYKIFERKKNSSYIPQSLLPFLHSKI